MGHSTAADAAQGVQEGWVSLRQAIAVNLTSNHYPPLPLDYVEPVLEAVTAVNEGEPDRAVYLDALVAKFKAGERVPLPRRDLYEEIPSGRSYMLACDLLAVTHSWVFTDQDSDDYYED